MRRLAVLAGLAAASSACGSASHAGYVVVTVDARPAVHDAASITVTLANAGTMRSDSLMLGGKSFPVTFSVSAPGRTGELAIAIDALDAAGLVVGHGSAMTSTAAPAADVLLDSTDFVVNTDYAGNQFTTDDVQAAGFQLAAAPDGTWTAVFRDGCMQSACNVFARRFARDGKPVTTQAAASGNAFVVTRRASDNLTQPAVGSSPSATVALWNFTDPPPASTTGVACRTISATGALGADQTSIITNETLPDALAVTALSTGDFVAVWNAIPDNISANVIRAAILEPDCSVSVPVKTVSTGAAFVDRDAIATSGDHALLTWVSSGDLHAAVMTATGALAAADLTLIPQTATDNVVLARIAAAPGGGFALAVRWASKTAESGKIELYQVDATGALGGAPVLISDQSGGNFYNKGFGLASRPDGAMLIVWHVCDASGSSCKLYGRFLDATGAPVSDTLTIPTTLGNSQKLPSVVALPDAFAVVWTDSSGKAPDTSDQAVRARILYPPGS